MSKFLPVHVILEDTGKVNKTSLSECDIMRIFRNNFCCINSKRYAEYGNYFNETYREEYAYVPNC